MVDVPSCNLRDEGFGREDGRWGTRKGEEGGVSTMPPLPFNCFVS